MPHSSHIAYFDESGDHGLARIDPQFPVFVLCGCVFKVSDYLANDLQTFSNLKFRYFGHDAVIFHSRDIRKQTGFFQVLMDPAVRAGFMADVSTFFATSSTTIISAAIHKENHRRQYVTPDDPYEISLLFCLERLYALLRDRNDHQHTTTCVFEERGDAEDKTLAAHFGRICAGANRWGPLPFRLVFANKKTNMPGLQIADLAAYPIARHVMAPQAPNPSYAAIEPRIRRSPQGRTNGWGLKIFP